MKKVEEITTIVIKLADHGTINFIHYYVFIYRDVNVRKMVVVFSHSIIVHVDHNLIKHSVDGVNYIITVKRNKNYYFMDIHDVVTTVHYYGDIFISLQGHKSCS